jgi:hypothetical protein
MRVPMRGTGAEQLVRAQTFVYSNVIPFKIRGSIPLKASRGKQQNAPREAFAV